MNTIIDIFSEDISSTKYQINYIESFIKKFGSYIDSDDPFYFNETNIINGMTGERIEGALLEKDSWKRITNVLLKYFHIDI